MSQPHEELLQIVDSETGEPTGEMVPRSEALQRQLWCRSTNIFVLNSAGDILCHQRSLKKERFPGAWCTHFGGHVTEGESFKLNALKELEEEIGIKVSPIELVPWRTSRKTVQRLWMRDFITMYNGPIESLTMQESEIQQVKWFSPKEILNELDAEGSLTSPNQWIAGTFNFAADYGCMRAVLTAILDMGIFRTEYHHLHKWEPPTV